MDSSVVAPTSKTNAVSLPDCPRATASPNCARSDTYELRGLVARELGSKKVIIPIWHNVTKDEVLSYSPPLADKMAIVNNNETIEALSLKLLEAIRPDISQNISRIIAYRKHVQSLPTQKASLNQIQRSREVRHKQLSPKQVVRIRNIRTALLEVFDSPFEDWLDGFKRDVDVDSEIWIWEGIVAGYNVYKELFKPEVEELKGVFGTLLSASTNDIEETLEPEMLYGLDQNKRHTALKIWYEVSKEVNLVIEAE